MYALLRPLLFLMSAETAHRAVMVAMRACARIPLLCGLLRAIWNRRAPDPRLAVDLLGLHFPTPIGLAAGLDKDGEAVRAWEALGFGFVEVGTVTPRAQPGNPRPRLFRLPRDRALINRMGFNNRGATAMARALARPHAHPLGVNLGKNKDTPNARAPDDYLESLRALWEVADYFVVNVSSPNTPGLRDLQTEEALAAIVRPLLAERDARPSPKPILVKLAPDLSDDDAVALSRECEGWGVDGLVVANTTVRREGLQSPPPLAAEAGGLSGAPLHDRAVELIRSLSSATRLPIIGVGGVSSGRDALELLRAGARLVQVYTAFVYGGPGTPSRLAQDLAALRERP